MPGAATGSCLLGGQAWTPQPGGADTLLPAKAPSLGLPSSGDTLWGSGLQGSMAWLPSAVIGQVTFHVTPAGKAVTAQKPPDGKLPAPSPHPHTTDCLAGGIPLHPPAPQVLSGSNPSSNTLEPKKAPSLQPHWRLLSSPTPRCPLHGSMGTPGPQCPCLVAGLHICCQLPSPWEVVTQRHSVSACLLNTGRLCPVWLRGLDQRPSRS